MNAALESLLHMIRRDIQRAEPRLTKATAVECLDCGCLTGSKATVCPACASRSLVLAFPGAPTGVESREATSGRGAQA